MKRSLFIIVLVAVFALGGCGTEKELPETSQTEESTAVSTTEHISEAERLFNQIKVGMTYEEVTEILGPEDADVGSGVHISKYIITEEECIYVTYMNDYFQPGHPVCVTDVRLSTPSFLEIPTTESLGTAQEMYNWRLFRS